MLKWINIFLFVAIITGLALMSQSKGAEIPRQVGYVNDFANVLTRTEKVTLEIKSGAILRSNGDRPQVITILPMTLNDTTVEDFAQTVFTQWKIGQAKKDNGVLIVLAVKERKIRIHTGYGVEGFIPDAEALTIIEKMKPAAGAKQWAKALDIAITEVGKLFAEEAKPVKGDFGIGIMALFVLLIGGTTLFVVHRVHRKEQERLTAENDEMTRYSRQISQDVRVRRENLASGGFISRSPNAIDQQKKLEKKHSVSDGLTGAAIGAVIGHSIGSSSRSSDDDSRKSSSSSDYTPSSSWAGDSGGSTGGGGDTGGGGASGDF